MPHGNKTKVESLVNEIHTAIRSPQSVHRGWEVHFLALLRVPKKKKIKRGRRCRIICSGEKKNELDLLNLGPENAGLSNLTCCVLAFLVGWLVVEKKKSQLLVYTFQRWILAWSNFEPKLPPSVRSSIRKEKNLNKQAAICFSQGPMLRS
jgi:hypothetical protein